MINKVQIILSLLRIIKFKATNNSFNLDISLLIILIVSIRKLRSIHMLYKIKTLTILKTFETSIPKEHLKDLQEQVLL